METLFKVTDNSTVVGTFPTFAEAEAVAREHEANYDSLFYPDEYRDEHGGYLTLTMRSEQGQDFYRYIQVKSTHPESTREGE